MNYRHSIDTGRMHDTVSRIQICPAAIVCVLYDLAVYGSQVLYGVPAPLLHHQAPQVVAQHTLSLITQVTRGTIVATVVLLIEEG